MITTHLNNDGLFEQLEQKPHPSPHDHLIMTKEQEKHIQKTGCCPNPECYGRATPPMKWIGNVGRAHSFHCSYCDAVWVLPPPLDEPTEPKPRFCKDCRYFQRDHDGLHVCRRSKARIETQDLVEGKIITDQLNCSSMRVKGGVCGQEGRLWEN